jgi:hypothetical protein
MINTNFKFFEIMKTTNRILFAIAIMLLCFNTSIAQEEQAPPQYYTVTTLHWDMDYDGDDDWMAIEKEYLEKVTMKNEYVMASSYWGHRWTADNSEFLSVIAYADWAAIDKATKRNAELEKEAWPDKAEREAFLNKQAAFTTAHHADEIYAVLPGTKHNPEAVGENRILYYQTKHFAFPEDGTDEEFDKLHSEYVTNIINKNETIVGYYPHAHAWGSDKREFKEAYVLNSMDDLEKMGIRNGELIAEYWKDKDDAMKAFFKAWNKYTTGFHGDAIYSEMPELTKK